MNTNQVVNLNQLGVKPTDFISFNPNNIVDTMLKHECLGEAIHRALSEKEKYVYGKVKDLQVVYPNFGYICTPNHMANFGWNILSRLCFVSEEKSSLFVEERYRKRYWLYNFQVMDYGRYSAKNGIRRKQDGRWMNWGCVIHSVHRKNVLKRCHIGFTTPKKYNKEGKQ